MSKNNAEKILREYFAGTLSPELEEKVRDWLADVLREDTDDHSSFGKFFDGRIEYRKPTRQTYKRLAVVQERLGFPRQYRTRIPLYKRTAFRVAAVLIPVFVLGGVALTMLTRPTAEPAVAMVTVTTGAEEQKHLLLPDGSEVWLNSASCVSYPEDFNGNRNVKLSGEGFFRVKKAAGAEFSVRANGLTATVRGTEFNVKAREGDPNTEVLLAQGSLEVKAGRKTVEMKPRDLLVMNNGNNNRVTVNEAQPGKTDWRKPLGLNDMNLNEALRKLALHYNMELRIEGSFPDDDSINVTFDPDTGLVTTMEVLRNTLLNFSYTIENDTLIIYAR